MKLCAFGVQIGNYRAYATMPRNKFSTNDQDLRNNPTEANCLVRVLPVIYRFMVGWLSIWWFEVPLSLQFLCFDSCFPRLWKFFVTFGISTSFEWNLRLFPVDLAIYYAGILGSFVFFLSIICQRTWLLLKEEIFVINIPLARSFTVFT